MSKTFTCICGKVHAIIPGKPVQCYGPGHEVYRSAEYFQYRLDLPNTTKVKSSKEQMSLF